MKEKFNHLSILWKTTIITTLITIVVFLCFIPFNIIGQIDIAFGVLLGGASGAISFLLFSLTEKKEGTKGGAITIVLIIVMSLLHIGVLVLSALLSYMANVKIFNIFSTFGSIFIAPITFVIVNLTDKKEVSLNA